MMRKSQFQEIQLHFLLINCFKTAIWVQIFKLWVDIKSLISAIIKILPCPKQIRYKNLGQVKNEMWVGTEKMFDIVDAKFTIIVHFIPQLNANYCYL